MAKKYLSLEEAAATLGVTTSELTRLREKGDIRGFADRGTWKFKAEDVEEVGRRRQADSNPSVPMLDSGIALDDEPDEGGSSTVLGGDDDVLGEQPTIVRGSGVGDQSDLIGGASDSDVRLILDDSLTGEGEGSDPDVALGPMSDSDSDVQLIDESQPLVDSGSDSDVKLVEAEGDSDSDVKLVESDSDSDSDVALVGDTEGEVDVAAGDPGSDSDVRLLDTPDETDTDAATVASPGAAAAKQAAGTSDGEPARDPDSGLALAADSGIALAADSGIALAADSGITLDDAQDSGISLEGPGSSVVLDEDDDDSGIALAEADDSGIALAEADDSGIALAGLDGKTGDKTETIPLMGGARGGDSADQTQLEVPAAEDESEYELGSDSKSDANVILFDDEDDDDRAGTVVKKSARDEDEFDMMDGEEFDFGTEEEAFDDELEVAEDVLGEDDELEELDVFDAGDEDFADSFQSGESHAEFMAPAGQVAAPVEQDWGTGTFVALCAATLLMVICSLVMFDFVRSMWSWNQPTAFTSVLLDQIGGFFKK